MPKYTKHKRPTTSPLIAGMLLASGAVFFGLSGHAGASPASTYTPPAAQVQVTATSSTSVQYTQAQQTTVTYQQSPPTGTQQHTQPAPASSQHNWHGTDVKQAPDKKSDTKHDDYHKTESKKDSSTSKHATSHKSDERKQDTYMPTPYKDDKYKQPVEHKDGKRQDGKPQPAHQDSKPEHTYAKPAVKPAAYSQKQDTWSSKSDWSNRHQDDKSDRHDSYKSDRHDQEKHGYKSYDKAAYHNSNDYKPVKQAAYTDTKQHGQDMDKDNCQRPLQPKHDYKPARHDSKPATHGVQQPYFPVKYQPKHDHDMWQASKWDKQDHKGNYKDKSHNMQQARWENYDKDHQYGAQHDRSDKWGKRTSTYAHASKYHQDHYWQASDWREYKGDYDMSKQHMPMAHTASMHKPMVHYAAAHGQHMNQQSMLQSALQEHAVLGVNALKAAYMNSADKDAVMKALEQNNLAVVKAVDQVHPGVGQHLSPLWAAHNGYYVQYLTAAVNHDNHGKRMAQQNLQHFAVKASTVLAQHSAKLEQQDLQHQLAVHGSQVTAIIDTMVAGNFDQVYKLSHQAYLHMAMLATTLAGSHMA